VLLAGSFKEVAVEFGLIWLQGLSCSNIWWEHVPDSDCNPEKGVLQCYCSAISIWDEELYSIPSCGWYHGCRVEPYWDAHEAMDCPLNHRYRHLGTNSASDSHPNCVITWHYFLLIGKSSRTALCLLNSVNLFLCLRVANSAGVFHDGSYECRIVLGPILSLDHAALRDELWMCFFHLSLLCSVALFVGSPYTDLLLLAAQQHCSEVIMSLT